LREVSLDLKLNCVHLPKWGIKPKSMKSVGVSGLCATPRVRVLNWDHQWGRGNMCVVELLLAGILSYVFLLVKLNGACGAFALYALRLVKLTPDISHGYLQSER
jgi:hypothetical protein